jgi:hydrogenase nickel incorporation protein HypA/HybF
MHELTVAASLCEWAFGRAREVEPRRLLAIELERDPLSGLNPEALEFGFRAMAAETELAETRLEWVSVDPSYACRRCGRSERAAVPPRSCRTCGEAFPRLRRDDSLRIRSIEVD